MLYFHHFLARFDNSLGQELPLVVVHMRMAIKNVVMWGELEMTVIRFVFLDSLKTCFCGLELQ